MNKGRKSLALLLSGVALLGGCGHPNKIVNFGDETYIIGKDKQLDRVLSDGKVIYERDKIEEPVRNVMCFICPPALLPFSLVEIVRQRLNGNVQPYLKENGALYWERKYAKLLGKNNLKE